MTTLFAELLGRGERVRFRALGASMTPSVRHGDLVHVDPRATPAIRPGDVVCYELAPGRLGLHRVFAVKGDAIGVRGDALAYRETVARGRVLGALVAVERAGRLLRRDTSGARLRGRLAVHLAPVMRVGLTALWRLGALVRSRAGA
jgi:hypothetical protein